MSAALNVLVQRYLDLAYPLVAKKFAAEAAQDAAQCVQRYDIPMLCSALQEHEQQQPNTTDNDDDDDDVTSAQKTNTKNSSSSRSNDKNDTSDDEVQQQQQPPAQHSGHKASNGHAGKRPRHESASPTQQQQQQQHNTTGVVRRFQRIDPTKVTFAADALRDNRPRDEHLTLRQNQEMMRVKGKGFNKLKQKNKGKLYAAGVDLTVRSYQFPDSDEE